jgi:hypothetical protein
VASGAAETRLFEAAGRAVAVHAPAAAGDHAADPEEEPVAQSLFQNDL